MIPIIIKPRMERTEYFKSDETELFYRVKKASAGSPKAAVIIIHGMGDHSSAIPYLYAADRLAENGYSCYAFDLRGHGRSQGYRMYTESWDQMINDVRNFVNLIKTDAGELPLFVIGMSMGGLIALSYAGQYPDGLRGIVAIAPAVDPTGAPLLLRLAMPLLARLTPKILVKTGLDYSNLTRDAEVATEYTTDPDYQIRATPKLGAAVLSGIKTTNEAADKFTLPLLILHGTADKVVPEAGSAKYFDTVASVDKKRITYDGAYHNLFIELNRSEVVKDVTDWLNARLS